MLVAVLAFTVTVSYGILLYAFSVVLAPMQAELGWSQATLTGGFSVAALVAGVAAVPIGRWLDRYGGRVIMTSGCAAAALLLIAWSRVDSVAAYYAIWAGLGACMAAVFYEPAFVIVTQWLPQQRVRAITIITLAGALASTIFVPLTTVLVQAHGWRDAIAYLAFTLALLTILPHWLVLPRSVPEDLPRGDVAVSTARAHDLHGFRWLAAALFLSTLAGFAMSVHLIPLLVERGTTLAFAASAMAGIGLAKLPGRLLLAPLLRYLPAPAAAGALFALQAVGIAALLLPGSVAVWLFVVLFGATDGAATPVRPALTTALFGVRDFGRISGALAFFPAAARAVAPAGASLLYAATGGYVQVVCTLALAMLAATAAVALAGRALRPFAQTPVYPDASMYSPGRGRA